MREGEGERGRAGGREGGREGAREREGEVDESEGGREGGKERVREGGKESERWREGERKIEIAECKLRHCRKWENFTARCVGLRNLPGK